MTDSTGTGPAADRTGPTDPEAADGPPTLPGTRSEFSAGAPTEQIALTVTLSPVERDALSRWTSAGTHLGDLDVSAVDPLDVLRRVAAALRLEEAPLRQMVVETYCDCDGPAAWDALRSTWVCAPPGGEPCGWTGLSPVGRLVCPHCDSADLAEVNVATEWSDVEVRVDGADVGLVVESPVYGDWEGDGWICRSCLERLEPPAGVGPGSMSWE